MDYMEIDLMVARDHLIFALDVDSSESAEGLVRMLASEVGVFKVGLELFIAQGPGIVASVKRAGAKAVFLDLKLHDIPATMRSGARSAAGLGVDFLTCHADQPGIFTEMDLGKTRLLGITVLTSLSNEELDGMGYPPELCEPSALVKRRAGMAMQAGCNGVVCSGHEAEAMRELLGPDALVVCPGIRMASADEEDDQKRVMTPRAAMAAGASHIVVGRPIRNAADPVAAARQVCEGIAKGLEDRGA
jgi:orotidine-5'-phosphate decarboxylase